MKCPSCGFENEAGVNFCGDCGAKLTEGTADAGRKIFCPNCGEENPPGSRFCQICGSEMAPLRAAPRAVSTAPLPVAPVPDPILVQAAPGKRTPGWVWMFAGIAVVLIAAGAYYFLSMKSAETLAVETEVAASTPPPTEPPAGCWSEENILYSEDFEDGKAGNWRGLLEGTSMFSIVPAPDDPQNMVLLVQKPEGRDGQVQAGPRLEIAPFSNAVLRLRFFVDGPIPAGDMNWFSFNWLYAPQPFDLQGQEVFDSRYQLPIGYNYFEMRRLQQPLTNVSVNRGVKPTDEEWHSLEIATYQPLTEVWLDGAKAMKYEDPNPLPAGSFGLEAWIQDAELQLLFDDIVICELKGRYQP